jgi:hypothetical protein
MFTNREVSQLDERDLHLARKTLIKYQNLRNVMKPSKENVQSIDIRTIFDQFRLNTLQRSRNGDTSLEGAINTAGDFFYV